MSRERERPPSRVTRLEAAVLLVACAVLVGIGLSFALAVAPRSDSPSPTADDGPSDPAATYRAEQPVEAWHAGHWYPAHVHSAAAARYFITYDDFSISWHEWVTARRLRPRPH
ncbi:MAG TPA: hypothetical protein VLJ38_20155 [Polyangiaceae bacterium]|nr:hypothetical protein [Polyangiaceae bacterium]